MKLKRATYRHIEAEIFSYTETIDALKQLRLEIMYGEKTDDQAKVSGGGYISSSIVERRATRLADSLLLREMGRITETIRETYWRAKDEARRIIWAKYGLAIDWQPPKELVIGMGERNRFDTSAKVMAEILAVDESTFHRYRTGFVYGIAERLGWW